jgi:hypothetical protein
MVEARRGGNEPPRRICLCCGAATASRSIPACWDHWNALPEDLRSSIVVSQGRGQLKVYADSLFDAVRLWRHSGAWRSKYQKAAAPVRAAAVANTAEFQSEHRVISLLEHRLKSAGRAPSLPGSAAALSERAAKSRP